jgi:hypothetical protein
MIHKRLSMEGKKGLVLQECLFDDLWEDSSRRIRASGVNEFSVSVHIIDKFLVEITLLFSL